MGGVNMGGFNMASFFIGFHRKLFGGMSLSGWTEWICLEDDGSMRAA